MLFEQEFEFQKKPIEIFEAIVNQDLPLEVEKGISLLYVGSKDKEFISQISNALKDNTEEDKEENEINKNKLFLITYKNIYIGGASFSLNLREGFGLNKYENTASFYLGQWKDNMKEGIGFLKIDENMLYIGSFHLNQFDGFGMLYYKSNNNFYFGDFDNGSFNKGLYCKVNKELFYRGKFNENKKNDTFCTFLEKNNKQLFMGEVDDDIFIKGYLCLFQANEIPHQNEEGEVEELEVDFSVDRLIYFDKTNEKNIKFIHNFEFENEFKNKIIDNMKKVYEVDNYNIGGKLKEIIDYFNYLESLVDDEDHNYLERYNEDNDQSLEKFFMSNYSFYSNAFQEGQGAVNIEEIRKEIEIPEINKDFENFE